MNPYRQRVDKDGLPIPFTFEDLERPDAPRRTRSGARWVRWPLIAVGLALAFGTLFTEQGRRYIAQFYRERAEANYSADDLPAALANSEKAVRWNPTEPRLYLLRALCRQETGDLTGSLADYNKLLVMRPDLAAGYVRRSIVYQRLERHREAVDDLTQAIRLGSSFDRHELLNSRAYARAIGKLELPQALEDIEESLRLSGEKDNAAYIDTRGYIYYLLGRHEEALADLDKAVALVQVQRRRAEQIVVLRRLARQEARLLRLLKENEAVMRHHRGLVYEKLDRADEAAVEQRLAVEMGFNPAAGVYRARASS